MLKILLPLVALLGLSLSVQADNELHYNLVSLEAKAEREVPNDLMQVSLNVEHEGNESSTVADKVNKDMRWALAQLKKHKKIKQETGQYNTYPIYDKRKVRGWRASQQLVLESDDFELLSAQLKVLQTRLQVSNMQFLPKKSTREAVETELIREAISAFKARAQLVTESMQEEAYDVVDININRQGGYAPANYGRVERKAVFASAALEQAPAVSAGESTISVFVNGRIQLK